jgi:hypothetical protein
MKNRNFDTDKYRLKYTGIIPRPRRGGSRAFSRSDAVAAMADYLREKYNFVSGNSTVRKFLLNMLG